MDGNFLSYCITFREGKLPHRRYYIANSFDEKIEEDDRQQIYSLPRQEVPRDAMFPACRSWMTVADEASWSSSYVEVPNWKNYRKNQDGKQDGNIPKIMEEEIRILEQLREFPHKNIAKYLGCVMDADCVVGICLEKCEETLYERTWLRRQRVDVAHVVGEVKVGIDHLHGIGLCHNDISPHNIMFRADGSISIVDFDPCRKAGSLFGPKFGSGLL